MFHIKKFYTFLSKRRNVKITILSHVLTFPLTCLARSGESLEKGERERARERDPVKEKQRLKIPRIISTSSDFNTVDQKIGVGTISAYLSKWKRDNWHKIFPYL